MIFEITERSVARDGRRHCPATETRNARFSIASSTLTTSAGAVRRVSHSSGARTAPCYALTTGTLTTDAGNAPADLMFQCLNCIDTVFFQRGVWSRSTNNSD